MAIAIRQIATAGTYATNTVTPTLAAPAVAGNWLVAIGATTSFTRGISVNDASYDEEISSSAVTGSGAFGWLVTCKRAEGGETSWTSQSAGGNKGGVLIEVEGFVGVATLNAWAEDVANRSTPTNSQGTGTATATAAGFAIAVFVAGRYDLVNAGHSYSDSFAEELDYNCGNNARPGIFVASKAVSAGSVSCTFSTPDTGDEMIGCVLVLVDDTGGGGSEHTISGAVTHTLTPAASLDHDATHTLSGAVTHTLAIAATLDADFTQSLSGAVTLSLTPAATMAFGAENTIEGAVSFTMAPSATLDTDFTQSLAGAVTFSLTSAASFDLDLAHSLSGAVAYPLTVAATMAYTAAGSSEITGAVPFTLTPAASFALTREYRLAGSVPYTLTPAAAFDLDAIHAFAGAVSLSLTPAAGMVYAVAGAGGVDVRDGRHHGGGIPISDERHPYWRNRIEVEDEPAPEPPKRKRARRARPDHAGQGSPTGDHLARAATPGAEVVKALLGVPLPATEKAQARTSGAPPAVALSAPPARPDAASDALSREQRLIEELLLLELID